MGVGSVGIDEGLAVGVGSDVGDGEGVGSKEGLGLGVGAGAGELTEIEKIGPYHPAQKPLSIPETEIVT